MPNQPTLRYGTIGSGKPVVQDDALRTDFSARHGVIAYDTEFDQCLESITGNKVRRMRRVQLTAQAQSSSANGSVRMSERNRDLWRAP